MTEHTDAYKNFEANLIPLTALFKMLKADLKRSNSALNSVDKYIKSPINVKGLHKSVSKFGEAFTSWKHRPCSSSATPAALLGEHRPIALLSHIRITVGTQRQCSVLNSPISPASTSTRTFSSRLLACGAVRWYRVNKRRMSWASSVSSYSVKCCPTG